MDERDWTTDSDVFGGLVAAAAATTVSLGVGIVLGSWGTKLALGRLLRRTVKD